MKNDDLFVCKLPEPLSKEEMCELVTQTQNGSTSARDKLIIYNIKLVLYQVLNRFLLTEYEKTDLISTGIIGLIKAVDSYDLSKKYEFTTYATKCIDNEILNYIRRTKKYKRICSLDEMIRNSTTGSKISIIEMLSDNNNIVEEYEQKELKSILRELINNLPEREREIIRLYYGFYNDKLYTQTEIAKKFNISRAQISNIIIKTTLLLEIELQKVGVIEANRRPFRKKHSRHKIS